MRIILLTLLSVVCLSFLSGTPRYALATLITPRRQQHTIQPNGDNKRFHLRHWVHIRDAPSSELGSTLGSTPRRSASAPYTAELTISSAVQCSTFKPLEPVGLLSSWEQYVQMLNRCFYLVSLCVYVCKCVCVCACVCASKVD